MKICCVGSGHFSVAISKLLAKDDKNEVTIWTHDTSWISKCEKKNKLIVGKEEYDLDNIKIIDNIDLLGEFDVVFILVSSKYIIELLNSIKDVITKKETVFIGSKGLISMEPYIITSYAKKTLKTNKIGYIAGPNLANDIINNAPCSICISSNDKKTITLGKHLFCNLITESFKDPKLIEVASVLKNIYAIGSGMIYQLYPYSSTLYSFTSKAFIEYQNILSKYCKYNSKKAITSIIGDFMMTTNEQASRNFKFGMEMSKSLKDGKDFLKKNTVEGYDNIDFMREFMKDQLDNYPIIYAIYRIIYKNQKTDILLDICKNNY